MKALSSPDEATLQIAKVANRCVATSRDRVLVGAATENLGQAAVTDKLQLVLFVQREAGKGCSCSALVVEKRTLRQLDERLQKRFLHDMNADRRVG
ncbi:hypothetical protein GQ600_4515 [Phytophthora cactorum]|nr:hypothetical protein GQ600_4515 [Phytophthora cactorum]